MRRAAGSGASSSPGRMMLIWEVGEGERHECTLLGIWDMMHWYNRYNTKIPKEDCGSKVKKNDIRNKQSQRRSQSVGFSPVCRVLSFSAPIRELHKMEQKGAVDLVFRAEGNSREKG